MKKTEEPVLLSDKKFVDTHGLTSRAHKIQTRIESTISPNVLNDLPSAGSSPRATQRSEKRILRFQRGALLPTGPSHMVLRQALIAACLRYLKN